MNKVVLLKKLRGCIAELRRQDEESKLHGQSGDINRDKSTEESSSTDNVHAQPSREPGSGDNDSRESSTVADREEREVQSVRGPAGAELLRRLEKGELTPEQERIVRMQLGLPAEGALTATTSAAVARASPVNEKVQGEVDGPHGDVLPDRPLQSSYLVPDD